MQFQLSLKIADRLHHDLLVRGEPLEAAEAACALLSALRGGALPLDVLDTLVQEDRRFCWAGGQKERLALRSWHPVDTDLSSVPFVALDLETTGAKAGPGKITEIGAVRIEGLRVVREFHSLVNPQRAIPPMISRITGITESMVADSPRIEDLIPELLGFLEGAVVVAHNAPFDVGFLNYELHRLNSRRLDDGAIDTLPLSRALLPGLANYRLGTVAKALDSPVSACHRALEDAQAVAHVFLHLAGLMQDRGLSSLSALRRHGRGTAPAALEKLPLTRDLPDSPGVYVFMGEADTVLLVGSAGCLAEEVRSVFMPGPRLDRGVRTAVRLVESIAHEKAATPLEAVVREHQLLLERHPTHNPFRCSPAGYTYIRAGGAGPGLALRATDTEPRWVSKGDVKPSGDILIGPFRRRRSARAAVSALQACYPIRHCPRRRVLSPCDRGTSGGCLSPCVADAAGHIVHDCLVKSLVAWLSGSEMIDGQPDPLRRIEEAAHELTLAGMDEEARLTLESRGHILTIRRAYARLADARRLDFALLWPQDGEGRPSVRLNLVLRGSLDTAETLGDSTFERCLEGILENVDSGRIGPESSGANDLVAVPQGDLDCLLGVRRWLRETDHDRAVIVPLGDGGPGALAKAKTQIVSETSKLFARAVTG